MLFTECLHIDYASHISIYDVILINNQWKTYTLRLLISQRNELLILENLVSAL